MEILKFELPAEVRKYLREKKIATEWFYLLASLIVYQDVTEAPNELTPETNFENDLGMDSLEKIQLVMDLERILGIQVADDEAERFDTLGDVLEYLVKKQPKIKIPKNV